MPFEKKWTANQISAIEARRGSVLVSAAAGSGKTAVLVERVIKMITDITCPIDADRLLIVTFTNAAASEMRERIFSRISDMLSENPEDRNLQRQQILLTKTKICTIHSFCSDLIREYFYKLEVSSEFRIADENEISIIKEEAMNNVLEKKYKSKTSQFHLLVETFSSSKDDIQLIEVINSVYKFIESRPFPDIWMDQKLSFYLNFNSVEESPWGMVILKFARAVKEMCIEITEKSLELANEDDLLFKAFNPVLSSDMDFINGLDLSNWNSLVSAVKNVTFKILRAPRGYKDDQLKIMIAKNRDEVKLAIKKLKNLLLIDEAGCANDVKVLLEIVRELFEVVKKFSEEFYSLKLEKNVLDFSDLERLAAKLLAKPNDQGYSKTEDAFSIGERFDQIMVDEYQDTNETQDLIFRMISKNEENLFVVGDVKQSIYGFRQAMPEIFIRRKESYKIYSPDAENYPARIILGNNFRSRKGVTDAVNFIFNQIMSKEVGDIDYSDKEKLVATAQYEPRVDKDIQVHAIDLDSSFDDDMDVVEAKHIADIIKQKINSGVKVKTDEGYRDLTYSDCCVLLRSTKKHSEKFVKELQKNNVPAWCESGGDFLSATEICVMTSLLRVIDNPIQDIPMMSLLMSPLVMLSADDIAKIRIVQKDGPLYFAVKEFVMQTHDKRLENFLEQISNYRYMAATMPCSRLISRIYEKTNFTDIVQTMKNGDRRLANLRALIDYAKMYEQSGYKGVSDFIRFIDKIQSQNSDLIAPTLFSGTDDAVKVMSIHRSKGLEFPVCIIANCSRRFNKDKGDLLLHSELGVGIKIRDVKKLYAYSNFVREAIALELDRDSISEEMRILYVAMTRARENLIMLCSFKDVEKEISKLTAKISSERKFSPYLVRNVSSFADWILMCTLKHRDGEILRGNFSYSDVVVGCESPWEVSLISVDQGDSLEQETSQISESNFTEDVDYEIIKEMQRRFNFRYPLKNLESIPAKISVSDFVHKNSESSLSRPAFMNDFGMTALEKGTALHMFMQFADFQKASDSLEKHIDFLVRKEFLTQEQALAIDKIKVKKFLENNIAKRIIESKNILREFRFNINLKASEFTPDLDYSYDNEYVVLQGAIDCAFEESGEFVIVDYKTDNVTRLDELLERYSKQLILYKRALEECMKQKVKECIIYSFTLNKFCKVEI